MESGAERDIRRPYPRPTRRRRLASCLLRLLVVERLCDVPERQTRRNVSMRHRGINVEALAVGMLIELIGDR